MKPVDMQRVGVIGEGDCLMACVASILEVPLESLPAITRENDAQWFRILTDTAAQHGRIVRESATDVPNGYAIGIGQSPRFGGAEDHAVVALDGKIVHDPHPSRGGVDSVIYWLALEPAAPHPGESVDGR